MIDEGMVQQVASTYNVLRPDPLAWEHWIGALSSGAYKYGYGVMRSGDDEYDPIGVLAAVSGADWDWHEVDQAWAFKGNTAGLPAEDFAGWIGVRYHADLKRAGFESALDRLQNTIIEFGDKVSDLATIAVLLKRAQVRADSERERLERRPMRERMIGAYPGERIDKFYIDSRSPYADGGY